MKRAAFTLALCILISGLCDAQERPKAESVQALTVRHIPNPVPAASRSDSAKGPIKYVWKFRTEVRNNLDVPLRITAFDSYYHQRGEWIRQSTGKEPFTGDDFAEWYTAGDAATGGWIKPGAVAADGNNWNTYMGPVPWSRIKWVYEAEDADGHAYKGEAEVEMIPFMSGARPWIGIDASKLASISGTIMDADQKPPKYAQVRLAGMRGGFGEPFEAVVAGENGAFSMRAEEPGWYRILVYSPWHDRVEIPIVVDEKDRNIEIAVKLAPYDYTEKSGAQALPIVTFGPHESRLRTIGSIDRAARAAAERFGAALGKWDASGKKQDAFRYDWSPLEATLKKHMNDESDLAVRQYAAFELAKLPVKRDARICSKIIELLPASSSLWSDTNPLVSFLANNCERGKRREIYEALLRENPDRIVRASSIAQLVSIAHTEGAEDVVKRYYAKMKAEYGDVREIQWAFKMFDPNNAVVPGGRVPSFELRSMDNNETVSDKTLLGTYYLIDFWAVWCGHCVREMKDVHAAHRKFKNRNFAILGVSFDRAREDAVKFRKGKWSMPWFNAYVEGGLESDLARRFEIVGIPKPVLVGPDGKILAIDMELRGKQLEKTLKKYLEGSK